MIDLDTCKKIKSVMNIHGIVSIEHLLTLLAIGASPDISTADIARTSGVPKGTVMATMQRITKDGLVNYVVDPADTRALPSKRATLTPKGQELVSALLADMNKE